MQQPEILNGSVFRQTFMMKDKGEKHKTRQMTPPTSRPPPPAQLAPPAALSKTAPAKKKPFLLDITAIKFWSKPELGRFHHMFSRFLNLSIKLPFFHIFLFFFKIEVLY